jgi:hypothetical protein
MDIERTSGQPCALRNSFKISSAFITTATTSVDFCIRLAGAARNLSDEPHNEMKRPSRNGNVGTGRG